MPKIEEVESILKELKTYGATDQQIADYLDTNRVIINRLRNGKPNRGETGISYLPALRVLLARARQSQQPQRALPEATIVDSLPLEQEQEQEETYPVEQETSNRVPVRAIDILRSQQLQEIDIRPQLTQHVVMPQSRELQEGDGYRPETGYTYQIQEISPYERAIERAYAGSNRRKREAEIEAEMERQEQAQEGGYGRYCRVCGLHPIGSPCSYR